MESFNNLSRLIKGRVALITGAASGMGKATAQVFAAEGARVIVADINEDEAKNVCKQIESDGGEALAMTLDITDEEQIKKCVSKSIKSFGQMDYLINNAGIASPINIDDENYPDVWQKTLEILLTGQTRMIRACLEHLLKSDAARIVNISSTEGFGATPTHSPYTAAKHGVIGLTRSLALELGPQGITVNCICPGPINTNMTAAIDQKDKETFARRRVGLKRYGEPVEVAHATLSLCLPASSYINGVALPVDGGLSIRRA